MEEEKLYYFTFGEEMHRNLLIPKREIAATCYLENYALSFSPYIKDQRYCQFNIKNEPQSKVWGLVYEVSKEEFDKLYSYYNHEELFLKTVFLEAKLPVSIGNGSIKVFAHISNKQLSEKIVISERYALNVLKGCADLEESYKRRMLSLLSMHIER